MSTFADALRERVAVSAPRLRAISDAEAARKPSVERWSKKEILGHLIDSACNNHTRFVRAQFEAEPHFPNYAQESWVHFQGYGAADWNRLIELWAAYNRHLAEVVDRLSESALAIKLRVGEDRPVTLGWLVEDYVVHMDHHLAQLNG